MAALIFIVVLAFRIGGPGAALLAAARFDRVASREFPGYFEPVIVKEFSLRREEGEADGARRPVAAPRGPWESDSAESRPPAPGQR